MKTRVVKAIAVSILAAIHLVGLAIIALAVLLKIAVVPSDPYPTPSRIILEKSRGVDLLQIVVTPSGGIWVRFGDPTLFDRRGLQKKTHVSIGLEAEGSIARIVRLSSSIPSPASANQSYLEVTFVWHIFLAVGLSLAATALLYRNCRMLILRAYLFPYCLFSQILLTSNKSTRRGFDVITK